MTTGRVLGLDGGGSKTIAVVANPLGEVESYTVSAGLDPTAGPNWEAMFTDLATQIGTIDAATIGLPYHGEIPSVSARQTELGAALFGATCQVVNDVAVAFEGAFAGADGVLSLAGTGSMAWARGPLGTHRAGGWGDVFGDEGSAYWIGRKALGIVSQHLDGRRASPDFTRLLLTAMQVAPADLIGWTYGHANPRAAIALIARHVSALAQAGDAEAVAVMTRAASHLADLGRTAPAACGTRHPVDWSFAGGVFNDAIVLNATMKSMHTPPLSPRLPPVGGAVLMAARHAGWRVESDFIARLASSLAALHQTESS